MCLSDEHNLPDSPFTSPHKPYLSPSEEIIAAEDTSKNISTGPPPPGFALPSHLTDNLNCRICKGKTGLNHLFIETIELLMHHTCLIHTSGIRPTD